MRLGAGAARRAIWGGLGFCGGLVEGMGVREGGRRMRRAVFGGLGTGFMAEGGVCNFS